MKRLLLAGVLAATIGLQTGAAGTPGTDIRITPGATSTQQQLALVALKARLDAEIRASPARVGLAAIDLTTGDMISVNGSDRFPMASTVKVAIAAAFLRGVQDGALSLDRTYAMPAAERRMARGLGDMRIGGRAQSGAQLIEAMLTRSDNAAADIVLAAIGGTRGLEDWLRTTGVSGQRVDRSIAQLLSDHETRKRLRVGRGRHRHWITVSVPRAAARGDVRDSSTPEAMAALLVKLRSGELLDARRTDYLFDVMARCRTGPRRIRGLLPAGTPVAHKTGTMNGITGDVGIIGLPNGHHLAVALFETGGGGVRAHDRKIAQLSRMLYEGFSATS